MTSTRKIPAALLGLAVAAGATGCGTAKGTVAATPHFARGVTPGLVMSAPYDNDRWEYGRNDELLNVGQPPIAAPGWAEIRTYDRPRTSNGRPKDSSATYTQTFTTRFSY